MPGDYKSSAVIALARLLLTAERTARTPAAAMLGSVPTPQDLPSPGPRAYT